MTRPVGIISSALSPERFSLSKSLAIDTPWGKATLRKGQVGEQPVVYLARYGDELTVASHRINYLANLWALRQVGARRIISQNAIGSVNPLLRPGHLVIPHDFLDLTWGRPRTFFDSDEVWVRVDMTHPFCPQMRELLIGAARQAGACSIERGVFACTEGPRFETPAEIQMLRALGADLVGTPLVPEVVLARELGMCFASLAPIINFGAGLAPAVRHSGEGSMLDFYYRPGGLHDTTEQTIALAVRALGTAPVTCRCGSALESAVKGQLPDWYRQLPEL